MSYNVLLVDDDQRIRLGLSRHIDWNRLGYNPPVLAANVAQAREALLSNNIDLLVTDIRLPDESGLEFCRQVRLQYPDMPIFVLSAFSDFEYARDAIRFGVKRYFTKPTDLSALSSAMADTRKELDRIASSRESESAHARHQTRTYRFLLSHLWANLAHGVIKQDEALQTFFSENHIVFPYTRFLLLRLKAPISILTASQNLLYGALDAAECISHPFLAEDNSICFLLNIPDEAALETALCIFLDQAPFEAVLDISGFVASLDQLPECMTQLNHIHSSGRIRRFTPPALSLPAPTFDSKQIDSLLSAIGSNDEANVMKILDTLYPVYADLSFDARCDFFARLLLQLSLYMERFGISLSDLYGKGFSTSRMARQLEAPAQMDTWLREHIRRILSILKENQATYSAQIIRDVCNYISVHYAEGITLSSVAAAIYLSPSYVSKLFKKVTGEKFIDYLTSVRIEKAMQLLTSRDSRIYEVAEKVGYKSTKHFSQAFRAHTGKTPIEYKKSICGNEGNTP